MSGGDFFLKVMEIPINYELCSHIENGLKDMLLFSFLGEIIKQNPNPNTRQIQGTRLRCRASRNIKNE